MSLKAAYIYDVRKAAEEEHPMRSKAVFLKHFYWVIGRAQSYSIGIGVSIATILNEWEAGRDYWWLNYYQPRRQPKFHSNILKFKPYVKKQEKDKPRWTMARKKRVRRICKSVT